MKKVLLIILLSMVLFNITPVYANDNFASSYDEINYFAKKKKKSTSTTTTTQDAQSCESLLGNPSDSSDPAYYIQIALNVMKYAGIAACIVLTIVDFAKAILNQDKDILKPLGQKAGKRLFYAVLLFFIPIIVRGILILIDVYDTCGIG